MNLETAAGSVVPLPALTPGTLSSPMDLRANEEKIAHSPKELIPQGGRCDKIDVTHTPMKTTAAASAPITDLLQQAQQGDLQAEEYLFRAVFGHLRRLAAAKLRSEQGRSGLEPTELVNEVYLHLFGERTRKFKDRAHFWAVAAHAMRCILIDVARKRKASKRDAGLRQVTLNELIPAPSRAWPERLLTFEQLLVRLSEFDPRAAEILELKVFLGSTDQQVAEIIGLSVRTVKRDYQAAKAWLQAELSDAGDGR
jgi:RNA polymerase sigma factor (TIGR02999 family)